ncbi:hypothetical protein BC831DRAFT_507034 [Entophlyctis helioformis]|nr:hypothetical protein BC831DRAFT_507034 [Entophlyctis helioformis]
MEAGFGAERHAAHHLEPAGCQDRSCGQTARARTSRSNAAAAHSTVINITNDSATDTTSTTADSANATTTRSSWWAWLMSLIARLGMWLRLVFSPNTKACPPATATVTAPITATTQGPTANGPTPSATNTQRRISAHSKTTAKATATPTKLDMPAATVARQPTTLTATAKADSGVDVEEPIQPARIAAKFVYAKSRSLLFEGVKIGITDDGKIAITVKDTFSIKFDVKNISRCLQREVTGKHVQLDLKIDSAKITFAQDDANGRAAAMAVVVAAITAAKQQRAAAKAARIKAKKANRLPHDCDINTEDSDDDDLHINDFSTFTLILRASQALATYDASGVKTLVSLYAAVHKMRAEVCDVSGQDSFEWFGM